MNSMPEEFSPMLPMQYKTVARMILYRNVNHPEGIHYSAWVSASRAAITDEPTFVSCRACRRKLFEEGKVACLVPPRYLRRRGRWLGKY